MSIINIIDIAIPTIAIITLFGTLIHGFIKLEEKSMGVFKAYLQGAAYGISRSVMASHKSLFQGSIVEVLIKVLATVAIIALICYLDMTWTITYAIVSPLVGLMLYLVPEPKWSTMEKMSVDLAISLRNLK